jgi:iron complex outermembrane receptor protein
MSSSLRANVGNYLYNGVAMDTGAFGTVSYNAYELNNLSRSYLTTRFQTRQQLSDHYVENASFLKMDNLQIGYHFGQINRFFSLNLSAMIQNVFTITSYNGVDPESGSGIDSSVYPRPRIYSMTLGLEF